MPKVTISIPTRNEAENITELVTRIRASVKVDHEILLVDDSDDDTQKIAAGLGCRIVQGRRKGLGQAIIDGIYAADSPVVVTMDADLSHKPEQLHRLIDPIIKQGYDMTIGSRYVEGGDSSGWTPSGRIKSLFGAYPQWMVTGIMDSNSGFFAIRKSILEGVELRGDSWKTMLEVAFKANYTARKEVPITFDKRLHGESKNNVAERVKHAKHIIKLLAWKFQRYIRFALVGGTGAVWYFGLLYALTEYSGLWYGLSAALATVVAITNNYIINHKWTFKANRNNTNHIKGWFKYFTNSLIGDGADWLVLVFLTEVFGIWYMLSAFIASGVASIIKYTLAKKRIWTGEKRTATSRDYEWHAYFKGLPWQKFWKRKIAQITKEFAEKKSGNAGRMLDIGCGSSPNGLIINHDDLVGLEPNGDKIAYMQGKELEDCQYIKGDGDTISQFSKKSFDTVICIEVIEHLVDRTSVERLIGACHDILKDDGVMILATPNFEGFMGQAMDKLYGIFQPHAYQEEHQTKFGLKSLEKLCNAYGFKLIDSRIPFGADMVCLFEKYWEKLKE